MTMKTSRASLKLQRIDLFMKILASSDCSDEEKSLAEEWASALADEFMAKLRNYEYGRLMETSSGPDVVETNG